VTPTEYIDEALRPLPPITVSSPCILNSSSRFSIILFCLVHAPRLPQFSASRVFWFLFLAFFLTSIG